MSDWPDASLNSSRSFDVAIDAMRERLEKFRCERIGPHRLFLGDCREVLPLIGQVHSCVTDPPYHLTSVVKRFSQTSIDGDGTNEKRAKGRSDAMARLHGGFMGQKWDGGDVAFQAETWELVNRALLPGAHLAAFSGTRTYHRMAVAIEDAGFEVRDMLSWLYGSGFPKSHDVGKGIDRAAGAEREILGSKTFADGSSARKTQRLGGNATFSDPISRETNLYVTAPATEAAREWEGWGSALKPACEPICFARKPLIGTIAQNVLTHGTGAINVDACRVAGDVPTTTQGASSRIYGGGKGLFSEGLQTSNPSDLGRWPANVLHDSSLELLECFAAEDRTAIRFFYSPKVSSEERAGSTHPTMKPVDLMAWLVRLVTPPRGTCLDPFMGSGSTGIAAARQGFNFIGIEQSEEYFEISCRRIRAALEKPDLFIETPKSKPVQTDFLAEVGA